MPMLNGMGQPPRSDEQEDLTDGVGANAPATPEAVPDAAPAAEPLDQAGAVVGAAGGPEADAAASPDFAQHQQLFRWINAPNIADLLEQEKLDEIGQRVKREYEIDVGTLADWREKARMAMDLAMQVTEPKQYPWPNASNVVFPLLTTASIQFAARAYPAIVNGRRVVKGVVVGDDNGIPMMTAGLQGPIPVMSPNGPVWRVKPGAKRERATKIGEHMSWQLLFEQPEWESETDALLHILPIVGCAFRKTYFDPGKGRNASLMVPATSLCVNYFAKSVELAPRMTEELRLYPLEIKENERAGLFLKVDYSTATVQETQTGYAQMTGGESTNADTTSDDDAPRDFLEQHRWLDLDEDDFPEPYIVTIERSSGRVVRIVARYDAAGIHFSATSHKIVKIDPVQFYTKFDFLPNTEGGIYGMGFGHYLLPINKAVNTSLNMMIDAGHLQVTGGGFIGKGLSMHTGAVRFAPGEYKVVNTAGPSVRESIVPLQFSGPSPVLFNLLGTLIEAGKDIAAVKDVLTGEQNQSNVPATTTLALIEQGLKVFTGIYKRVHRALKSEFDKLYRLNRIYLPQEVSYQQGDDWKTITREDYAVASGVEPVSDPAVVTDMQRLAKAQFLMPFATDPMCNGQEIRKRLFEAADIEHPEQLIVQGPLPPPPQVMLEANKQQIEAKRNMAQEVRDLAQAIMYMSQADKNVGDAHLDWLSHQLDVYRAIFEAQKPIPGPKGPDGAQSAPIKPKVPPLPAAINPEQPHPEAKQAPDGNWYVPDKGRPGKYLQVLKRQMNIDATGDQTTPGA